MPVLRALGARNFARCFLPAVGLCTLLACSLPTRAAQQDIAAPTSSGTSYANTVAVLPNGNIVVTDGTYSPPGVANGGAVYLLDGATLEVISTLQGSAASDSVGNNGITVLSNGNFVVRSTQWNGGRGAATWGSATTGFIGGHTVVVSAVNSLVGSTLNDAVSGSGVTALTNGNYVVRSQNWDAPGPVLNVGAATWGDGSTGTVGTVSTANSLVGSTANDQVGSSSTIALANGNYVVRSPNWDIPGGAADVGAATWGDSNTGIVGTISAANSLVGSTVGDRVGFGGIALTNGNYVVSSSNWDIPEGAADVGAVTWGNGSTGAVGTVSVANSLVGSTTNDQVGSNGTYPLTNGNYVVSSASWDIPSGPANVGAATWGDGSTGIVGTVSAANSLVGSTIDNQVGFVGVIALTNGNYVVASAFWGIPGGAANVGAATWGNGSTGTVGTVSSTNSLVGSTANDNVCLGAFAALTNGNYVIGSQNWDIPGGATNVGAATWGNGSTGTVGTVSVANSLVGSTASDNVGSGVYALTNGNYVVRSQNWDVPAGAANVGAATWGNGSTGTVGTVSVANSLVGSTAGDQVCFFAVITLNNGNYVIRSPNWDIPGGATDVGAATWGNGSTAGPRTVGAVSATNSLVGSTNSDQVSATGAVVSLPNGDYLVLSTSWDNPSGPVADAGAMSYGNGSTGSTVGIVSAANSVRGTVASGIGSVTALNFDPVRNRTFVGRGSSKILSILSFPEIALSGNGINIPDGNATPTSADHTDFGSTPLASGTVVRTFTITNSGGAALNLTGTPIRVVVSGANAADFSVTTLPGSPIAANGGTTTFQVTFNPSTVGLRTATISIANDDSGENPFDFAIHGTGNAEPMLTLPSSPVVAEATGANGAMVSFIVSASDPEDGPLTPSVMPPSGSFFDLDDTTVNVSATDSGGATTIGSFVVRVQDTTKPTLNLPADIIAEATGSSGAVVFFANPTATDAVDGIVVGSCVPESGSAFAIGTTTVTITVKDAANNTETGTFNVTVVDSTAPAISPPVDTPLGLTVAQGGTVALPDYLAQATINDAVGVTESTQQPTAGTMIGEGITTVTLKAKDAAGNEATLSFDVTVRVSGTTVLAQSGAPVPDAGIDSRIPAGSTWGIFGVPSITMAGANAGWAASVRTPPRGSFAGIFSGQILAPTLRAKTSDPAVDANGAAVTGVTFKSFREPVFGHDSYAVLAKVKGFHITAANDTGIWCEESGALREIAREGATAPGTSVKFKAFASLAMPAGGTVFFVAKLAAPATRDLGLWRRTEADGTQLCLREGDTPPGYTQPLKSFVALNSVKGSPGHGRYITNASGGTAAVAVLLTFADGTPGLIQMRSDGGIDSLNSVGFKDANGNSIVGYGIASGCSASFIGAQLARLAHDDARGITAANDLEVLDGIGGFVVAQSGTGAPGVEPAKFKSFFDPVAGSDAQGNEVIAFLATLTGAPAAQNTGVWRYTSQVESTKLLAREGDEATDAAGAKMLGARWKRFTSLSAMDGRGPMFVAKLASGTARVTAANDTGLWATDPSGALRLVLREGDQVAPGKTLRSFEVLGSVAASPGQRRAWTSGDGSGRVIYRARFTDGTTAIVSTAAP